MIQYVNFEEKHFSIIKDWAIDRCKEEPNSVFIERCMNNITSPCVFSYVGYQGKNAVAFIQSYEASAGWWPDEDDQTLCLNCFFAPEVEELELKTEVIKGFLEMLLCSPKIKKIITGPLIDDKKSIQLYEIAGFKSGKKMSSPDGKVLYMELIP